jgi:hypothetical protein
MHYLSCQFRHSFDLLFNHPQPFGMWIARVKVAQEHIRIAGYNVQRLVQFMAYSSGHLQNTLKFLAFRGSLKIARIGYGKTAHTGNIDS